MISSNKDEKCPMCGAVVYFTLEIYKGTELKVHHCSDEKECGHNWLPNEEELKLTGGKSE
jgi:hypothetical protein